MVRKFPENPRQFVTLLVFFKPGSVLIFQHVGWTVGKKFSIAIRGQACILPQAHVFQVQSSLGFAYDWKNQRSSNGRSLTEKLTCTQQVLPRKTPEYRSLDSGPGEND